MPDTVAQSVGVDIAKDTLDVLPGYRAGSPMTPGDGPP